MQILVVDDDPDLVDQVHQALEKEGFGVIVAKDARLGLWRWRNDDPDLVLLEARIPGLNGLEACRRIKKASDTPVIMMTVADDEPSVIRGFEAGADDYLTKPLDLPELVLRVRAVLRRRAGQLTGWDVPIVEAGPYSLHPASLQVTRGDLVARLTPSEFRILSLLVRNAGRVVTFERLATQIWGEDSWWGSAQDASILRAHVSHIRKKLGMSDEEPGYIRAVSRTGYLLTTLASAPEPRLDPPIDDENGK